MVFAIAGFVIVGAIFTGVHFVHHHGVFIHLSDIFSRKSTIADLSKLVIKNFSVSRMAKALLKDLRQLFTLLVTIVIAVITCSGSTWQYFGVTARCNTSCIASMVLHVNKSNRLGYGFNERKY